MIVKNGIAKSAMSITQPQSCPIPGQVYKQAPNAVSKNLTNFDENSQA